MADDDVDYDLLEFMRAHMNGAGGPRAEPTLGVLESAEQIYDVLPSRDQELTSQGGLGRVNQP
jgi:pyridoxine 5'-phosphate synthase PdxJ